MNSKMSHPGIYRARIVSHTIEEKDGGTVQFVAQYEAFEYLEGGRWNPLEPAEYVYGYHFVIKKDGTPNEAQVKQLNKALGWTGDFDQLNDGSFENAEVQINVKEEDYQGATKLKVSWLNPRDHEGGMKSADESTVSSLNSRHGPALRAMKLNAKPTGKPTDKPATVQPDATAIAAGKSVWADHEAAFPDWTKEKRISHLEATATQVLGRVVLSLRDLSAEDWNKVDAALSATASNETGDDDENHIPF